MNKKLPPEQAARRFYSSLMDTQCHVSWSVFSKATQQHFTKWAKEEIYNRNSEAAKNAQLGDKEIKLLFERNDPIMLKFFWRRFFFSSGANEFFRFGYFTLKEQKGKKATVKVTLKYPSGKISEVGLPMVQENGEWKLAYVENNLPF